MKLRSVIGALQIGGWPTFACVQNFIEQTDCLIYYRTEPNPAMGTVELLHRNDGLFFLLPRLRWAQQLNAWFLLLTTQPVFPKIDGTSWVLLSDGLSSRNRANRGIRRNPKLNLPFYWTSISEASRILPSAMKLRYAMVCSSNQNRSMEAHLLLKKQGFDVSSYGTGAHVKLPGPSIREPNVYEFGTPYKQMFDDLRRKDPDLYPPILFLNPLMASFYPYPSLFLSVSTSTLIEINTDGMEMAVAIFSTSLISYSWAHMFRTWSWWEINFPPTSKTHIPSYFPERCLISCLNDSY